MKIKRGTTRITILTGKFAIKIPILNRSLKHFVKGWLGNVDERDIWKQSKNNKHCPVYFSFFGLFNIMPKAKQFENEQFDKQWILNFFKDVDIHVDVCSGWKNFGFINDVKNIVILDYATCRESSDECSDCDNNCILKK